MSGIHLEDVGKRYGGDIVAVDGFDLTIQDGEFITIVGPSGSGKSTILRMIAGLESITDGTISIGDHRINDVPPQDRDIAMVFQNYALYPHMTVEQNISYGLKLNSDKSDEEIQRRVQEATEMMGIGDQLDKKPSELSGGQQQRVATGRAIVRDPAAFLMDEPLSNLDAKLRTHMRTELQRIQEELETTTVYVTHDQEEAMTMSDRVVILNHGELQQVGTPRDVFTRPKNTFVAEFIGSPSMNFFDVRLQDSTLVGHDIEYSVSRSFAERIVDRSTNDDLILGIRPEHMAFAQTDDDNGIDAVLEVREPVGDDNYLYLRSGETEFTMRVLGEVDYEEGDRLRVSFDESDLHVFDRATGENVFVGRNAVRTTPTETTKQDA
ncbi:MULTISPECIES: sn-glycerol-3-phosphate ABC transporter ATP-binding protein UgpC [unclassified Haladaptatus]|uniref:ABC transporter ATP-binding protein n=1 Tax=unclassified Haladaptatus TaxID=2622732 RepID=UPI00209C054F|nr:MULTISPECIES: sn-glycerol-3-phosphate ABC transporter ATP-binding protein UgpC [unclassified Haladaptatus]MCO8243391.1 sn-glycerol-3-phosphate ABC transporter ATP-binding protein UgpC [Haladaptatus sp. AB643]MCO8254798.1 sn-glycerol-3-phosphate ABC transporter ATP-binding protein UgpC [Haladaptatus sp. AB618]